MFGAMPERPFRDTAVRKRAQTAWRNTKPEALKPITLHECRHTFASMLIASGLNLKSVSVYMGHADISTTLDIYGHLMPGSEVVDAWRLNEWLATQSKCHVRET